MFHTIQRIIEVPQLPLVFRWSMSLLCWSCRFSGAAVEKTAFLLLSAGPAARHQNSYAATQLCLAGFAGDDTARAVFGQTSTEASGRFYSIFFVNVNLDPEVDSRRENLDIISTSSIWQFLRQLQRLLEEFQVFFYVNADTNPEVDFRACPGAFCTRKSGQYSYELSDDV